MEDNKGNPFIYKRLVGGLDKATNFSDVGKSDFIDGYDIVDNSPKAYNEKGLLQPCSNTKFAYDLGEAELTKKKYRVSMNLTGLASCNILLNFKVLGISNVTTPIVYTSGQDAATLFAAIDAGISDYTFTNVSTSGFLLSFDLAYTATNYTDFFLAVTNSLGDVYTVQVLLDAVSSDKVGAIKPICFANINTDQQIFATTNTDEPVSILVTAPVAALGMYITFTTDPQIGANEEVYIYSATGGFNQFSALGFLTLYSGTTYSVNGTLSTAIGATGDYWVVRNYRTLSIIGYAQKNQIINKWNYTELLRSNKLNFRSYKQIQGELNVASDGIIYDFTDFLNQIKRLIYVNGSYGIGQWGFLTAYNSAAYYDLDSLEVESRLQLGVNTAKVTASVAGGSGGYFAVGAKRESCYAVFVRFKTADGAYTTYSKASNVLWLRSSSVVDHNYGLNSGRALQILIEQIETEFFTAVQVGIIEFTTSSYIGYSLPEVQITGESMTIIDSGFDTDSYLDFNSAGVLLESIPFVFENAKSILGYNNYVIAANVNLYREYDLTAWAQTIVLSVSREFVQIGSEAFYGLAENTISTILRGINEYDKCSSRYMSYMPYDHYRFCIFIDWENGSPTSTYWIDDVSFEPTDTGLSDDVISSVAGIFSIIQYIIEAKIINTDYILPDGKVLRDVVKDIRFGRALCNQQVQTTGFGAHVFNDGSDDYVSGFDDGANTQTSTKLALYSNDYQNTQQIFNYQDGDLLQTSLMQNEAQTTTGTSNLGVSFIGALVSASVAKDIDKLENIASQNDNTIALYKYTNAGDIYIRSSAAVELNTAVDDGLTNAGQYFFYIRPYGSQGAYPENPSQTRFFVIPQDQWYNKDTHDSSTVYKLYGGDAFATLSAYKIAENESDPLVNNSMFTYWHFNRTNAALRSGRFPYYTLENYLKDPYLVDTTYEGDKYTYDAAFTPRYPFQNQVAFNPSLPQITNKFSSLYYSGIGFGSDNAGGNRIWLPLDMKTLETKYGAIVDIDVLLGQTETNILIVLQERRLTAQYFDNTANIKSNTGELLIGNGKILERDGQNFTEFGCEHKWTAIKGQTATGKDLKYWLCLRKTAIMRFGADGTSNIIGNIAPLIGNKAILGLANGYNEDDAPAFFNGCHAVWDNKRMEYILTLRLMPKTIAWTEQFAQKGDFKADPELKWGFEQFPVIYKSLKDTNDDPVTDPTAWTTYEGYDSGYFEILTIVWNEENNVFKTYRTYSPKIYGQFNDNYVSSHPTQGNLIFEHNDILSEAIYYAVENNPDVETSTTNPENYTITGTGLGAHFPSPFVIYERQKYIITIEGKNYEVIEIIDADTIKMASVDTDDILPQVTISEIKYYVVNCQDPYIEGVANETKPMFVEYGLTTVQSNSQLKGMRFIAGLNSLSNQTVESNVGKARDEDYYQGTTNQQIPSPETPARSMLQGYWMKFKSIWRWGKSNKVEGIIINYTNVDKKV